MIELYDRSKCLIRIEILQSRYFSFYRRLIALPDIVCDSSTELQETIDLLNRMLCAGIFSYDRGRYDRAIEQLTTVKWEIEFSTLDGGSTFFTGDNILPAIENKFGIALSEIAYIQHQTIS